LLGKHRKELLAKAIIPVYYDEEKVKQLVNDRKQTTAWNYYLN